MPQFWWVWLLLAQLALLKMIRNHVLLCTMEHAFDAPAQHGMARHGAAQAVCPPKFTPYRELALKADQTTSKKWFKVHTVCDM